LGRLFLVGEYLSTGLKKRPNFHFSLIHFDGGIKKKEKCGLFTKSIKYSNLTVAITIIKFLNETALPY